jgi:hypothetical protein
MMQVYTQPKSSSVGLNGCKAVTADENSWEHGSSAVLSLHSAKPPYEGFDPSHVKVGTKRG